MLNTSTSPTREEIRAQLERILSSDSFRGTEVLKSFLRFVVDRTLNGQVDEVKEYTIATEVFGRKENYDPRIDSVVRVQATRLRSKLKEYYLTTGMGETVHIGLPKGHYIPAFSYAEANGHRDRATAAIAKVFNCIGAGGKDIIRGSWRLAASGFSSIGLAVISVLLGTSAYLYRSEATHIRQSAIPIQQDPVYTRTMAPFWGEFFSSENPVLVAYSNPVFVGSPVVGMKYWLPLDSAALSILPPSMRANAKTQELTDVYTGVGEVQSVNSLGKVFWRSGRDFRLERSLLVTWEDLKDQDIIFLGGPAENTLLRRLPQEQDFVHSYRQRLKNGRPLVRILNRHPRQGEQDYYDPVIEGPSESLVTKDYGVISKLKGVDPNRRLLILAGVTTFGTQACAEYISKPEHIQELIEHMNVSRDPANPRLPPYFQVLLEVKIEGSVPLSVSYVTHHVLE